MLATGGTQTAGDGTAYHGYLAIGRVQLITLYLPVDAIALRNNSKILVN